MQCWDSCWVNINLINIENKRRKDFMYTDTFLFDMDRVICDSHPLHVRALRESIIELAEKYSIDDNFDDLEGVLTNIIVGGNEKSILTSNQ